MTSNHVSITILPNSVKNTVSCFADEEKDDGSDDSFFTLEHFMKQLQSGDEFIDDRPGYVTCDETLKSDNEVAVNRKF